MRFTKVFIEEVRLVFPKNRALIVALECGDRKSAEVLLRLAAAPSARMLKEQAMLIARACDSSLRARKFRKRLHDEKGVDLEELKEAFPQNQTLLAAAEDQDHLAVEALLLLEEELSPRHMKDLVEEMAEVSSRAVMAKDLLEKIPAAWRDPKRGSSPLSEMPAALGDDEGGESEVIQFDPTGPANPDDDANPNTLRPGTIPPPPDNGVAG